MPKSFVPLQVKLEVGKDDDIIEFFQDGKPKTYTVKMALRLLMKQGNTLYSSETPNEPPASEPIKKEQSKSFQAFDTF